MNDLNQPYSDSGPIAETSQCEKLLRLQRDVIELVIQGIDPMLVLGRLCGLVESFFSGSVACVMLQDPVTGLLSVQGAVSLPNDWRVAFTGIEPGPNAGSCGTAFFSRTPVFVADTETDSRWQAFRKMARSLGIGACWSTPVMGETAEVLGTFSVTHKASLAPASFDVRLLETCAQLAGVILKRRAADTRLKLASVAFDNISEGIVVTDAAHRVIEINSAFARITGYEESAVIGHKVFSLFTEYNECRLDRAMPAAIAREGAWRGETWARRRNGEMYPQWLSYKPVASECGGVVNYLAVISDLSEVKASQKKVWELANQDALTGLPNRVSLLKQLDDALGVAARNNKNLALLALDLDNFKHINDSCGHNIGDLLLQQVARRLTMAIRKTDLIARLSGDEFGLMLHYAGEPGELERVAVKLQDALDEPFTVGSHEFRFKPGIGISLFPHDSVTAEGLLKNADTALHQAKRLGRNRIAFYSPGQTELVRERMILEQDLRKALERQEMFLHYQPQYEVDSGELVGAEALVRWQHPTRGVVPPDQFISIAEDSGLIRELGRWVLETACRQTMHWAQAGFDGFTIAVNLSGHQLEPGCAEVIEEVLVQTGMDASRLELEVTETSLMEQGGAAIQEIRRLEKLGLKFAMDDFGTGHSSMSQLKLLPIQTLKIDRSFVFDIPDDANDMAITSAIVVLAHALGMTVTAEGVETAAQLAFLRERGCDHCQGYFFSRPLSGEDFTVLLQQRAEAMA